MTEAYIYDAIRSPRGKGRPDGSLHEVTSVALSARVLNAVKERNGLEGHAVEDVIWWANRAAAWRGLRCWPLTLTNASPVLPSTASAPLEWRR